MLPKGWSLQASFTEAGQGSSVYVRVYASSSLPTPAPFPNSPVSEGPGRLFVYQAFNAPVDATIGDPTAEAIPVAVGGTTITLYCQAQTGQLFLTYHVGADGIALDAYEPDFTPASLAAIANGLSPSGPAIPAASP